MGIYQDNEDYKNQSIQKATKPQQNNSLFIIDSDENINETSAKTSIEMNLSAIGTKSKISYSSSDSDEDYNDLDNQRAKKLPIDRGLFIINKTPLRLSSVLTSTYPSKGLSMIDSENFKLKCVNVERNKKRRANDDEASGVLNYRKPPKPSSCNGLPAIDSENWDDLTKDNQFTTSQAKKIRSVSDSDDFNTTLNNIENPEILTKLISDSTDKLRSMEIDNVILDKNQTRDESESEEKEKVENAQSGSSPIETDESEKMRFLLSNFTEEQYDRYEKYRRSTFPKTKIKNVIDKIAGYSVSQNVVIAMAGIAKSFVGDIIEKSLDIQEKQGGTKGPLHPRQIREAVRQLRRQGKISCLNSNFSQIN